jgi:predicted CopG family antitoxin
MRTGSDCLPAEPRAEEIEGARELSASTDPIHSLQLQKLYLLSNLCNTSMLATKRLAVTEPVWSELSDLKRPGETFSQLLAEMIEREKKARLIEHLMQVAEEGDFVELPP